MPCDCVFLHFELATMLRSLLWLWHGCPVGPESLINGSGIQNLQCSQAMTVHCSSTAADNWRHTCCRSCLVVDPQKRTAANLQPGTIHVFLPKFPPASSSYKNLRPPQREHWSNSSFLSLNDIEPSTQDPPNQEPSQCSATGSQASYPAVRSPTSRDGVPDCGRGRVARGLAFAEHRGRVA
jgi:hypothetical protein